MNNRRFLLVTFLLSALILSLFVSNFYAIMHSPPLHEPYVNHKETGGVAIEHQRLLYTLNFEQQNRVLNFLNEASIAELPTLSSSKSLPVERLFIYSLEEKNPIELAAIGYVDENLVFKAPAWAGQNYLIENSNGALTELLAQSFD